jgi:hypothetical protein
MEGVESSHFDLFRDCLASPLIEKSSQDPVRKSRKARGNGRKMVNERVAILPQEPNDAEELAEFIDVSAITPAPNDQKPIKPSILPRKPSPVFHPASEH